MSGIDRDIRTAVRAGTVAAASMIAFQMAGKATRDALFLSTYDIVALPAMVMGASITSLVLAGLASRAGGRLAPAHAVPRGFALSATLSLIEWALIGRYPAPVTILMYLHFTGLGALLISGFWSVVSERFDPRTAKWQIGRMAAGGTVGGLLGGIMAERMAVWSSADTMFPFLALLHVVAAVMTGRMGRATESPALTAEFAERRDRPVSGLQVLRRSPYLTTIGVLVLLTAVGEGLLDLTFKGWATANFEQQQDSLLRFFAVFYTATALVTVLVQTLMTKRVLQRLGLALSAAGLPGIVAIGAGGMMLAPGFMQVLLARGGESVVRNSLYRSAYELLYNPVNAIDKRVIKPILDVGFVRMGDLVAGAIAQVVVFLSPAGARGFPMYLLTFVSAVAAIATARRLHQGYLKTLEKSLVSRGSYLEDDGSADPAQTTIIQTLGAFDLSQLLDPATSSAAPLSTGERLTRDSKESRPDPALDRIGELRSRDRSRVRAALAEGPMTLELVPHVVPLLAWDEVAGEAMASLYPVADGATGLLIDYLLDADSDFSIRRRLPLVLAHATKQRAADGLLAALEDRRFEVRYRCGRVLSRMHTKDTSLKVDRRTVLDIIDREVAVDRGVWESRRLLDATEDDESPVMDEALRDRADRSLEHVFTMLSLILPAQPLRVAFRGLFTDDAMLRGTALEYLESALPESLRRKLWPFLETPMKRGRNPNHPPKAHGDLLESGESMADRQEALKRLREASEDDPVN